MYQDTPVMETDQHLFTEEDLLNIRYASTGQRLLNFIIDALVMNYTLSFVTAWILVKFLLQFSPQTAYNWFGPERDTSDIIFAGYVLGIMNFLLYYTFCEKLFKGYTLGKLITGTKAVKVNGQEISWKDALLRSLTRIVPFELFSAFGGHPWHDEWTNTIVIKTR